MVKRPQILIVEDQLGPRKSLEMIFSPYFDILTVDSGEKGLNKLKERPVDVVTLDLRLPNQQGIDVLRQIKQTARRYRGDYHHRLRGVQNGARCAPFRSLLLSPEAL
ncbi:MAG: response regulator [Candidatus Manganitrophus sp.]|nr:response regulator [Candidatus Manganitrophus sp.]